MSEIKVLDIETLERAVAGEAAAFRSVVRLQPAGGPGDKVFPPTYATGDRTLKYVLENRRIAGETVRTVLLDSVASQANRMEEALLAAWTAGALHFPVIAVDFTGVKDLADLGRITALDAPHRIADALLRDSVTEDGARFPDSVSGRAFAAATVKNASAVYRLCPTALIFGVWNSTRLDPGPQNKFQRILVSEIVGLGVETGKKVGSRLDPAGIQRGVTVWQDDNPGGDWVADPGMTGADKPTPFSRGTKQDKGRPASINHGNVAPTVDEYAGGVTFDYARQTTVLSLPALRRLRFPTALDGTALDGERRSTAEQAARTALAALSLAAVAHQREQGYDLRSRSLLVPEDQGLLELEMIPAAGGEPQRFRLDVATAAGLHTESHRRAEALGFGWIREPLNLLPAPKLADLIQRSRRLAGTAEAGEGVG